MPSAQPHATCPHKPEGRHRELLVASSDLTITLQTPDTQSNFLDFNKHCVHLDSDYLMQPINEAEYDSETQVCVDRLTGGPASFYDHYTTKPVKKKGRAVGAECPMSYVGTFERTTAESASAAIDSEDFLQVPAERNVPSSGGQRGAFSDPVTRRLATGRLPPGPSTY